VGCKDDPASLPWDPPYFRDFFEQQLLAITWAKSMGDEVFSLCNTSRVGVAGHSMGGQATLFSSSGLNASRHGITAAVSHHGFSHDFPAPTVPFLAFTGSEDHVAPATMAQNMFAAAEKRAGSCTAYGLVDKTGADHLEPLLPSGWTTLAVYTAAWMKMYVDRTPQADGIDYHDLIYGKAKGSLCGGGDGAMTNCTLVDQPAQ
jgi:hypothetical protein